MSQTPAALPPPDIRTIVPMRDGAGLDTYVWLPRGDGPYPAILIRTPYNRKVTQVNEPPLLRYIAAGYALTMQQIRGVGASEGSFGFTAPHERDDGYDAVEWVAAQPWCTGAVGLDGHSYAGMTQLYAASARPPHLRCMAPAVVSVDPFAEPPYIGGAFSRMHSLAWAGSLQFESHLAEEGGAFSFGNFLTDPQVFKRWTSRPAIDAADGELTGDRLTYYRDALAHPTRDDWWAQRTLQPADYAAMDIPTLVVSGNFDPSVGALKLWRGLEDNAANPQGRYLLLGPWDHNGSYNGGPAHRGIYGLSEADDIDLVGLRLAFFDRHLKQQGPGPALADRATIFLTGARRWRAFDRFPPREVQEDILFLDSGGHANSSSGDGVLTKLAPVATSLPDRFVDDPAWPFYGPLAGIKGPDRVLDMHERARHHDTLVYRTPVLAEPLTLLGETVLDLFVAADVPDADIVVWLAEERGDGRTIMLAFGQLRLRYHGGFDAERLLEPGKPVRISLPITYIAHQLAAGHRLCLMIGGNNFPLLDPNPHSAEPIATATAMTRAVQTVFHDADMPSRLILPVLKG